VSTASFTELGHVYEQDGVIVPSVTQVLTLAGISDVSGIPSHILEKASAIGTAVHLATELLDREDLELESLDPQIVGYVVGYQKFKEEHEFKPRLIEHRIIAGVELPYGMCVDRVGSLKGGELEAVVDIKTSSRPQPSWAIQTAAYAYGLGQDYGRLIVHVAKDGTYKLIPHYDPTDLDIWRSALTVAHWRLRNGTKVK
jgi:hypothetical protein